MASDISKIIKRLELIKNFIGLEEEKDIAEQILKLMQFQTITEVQDIIDKLQNKSYSNAVNKIEEFIKSHNQITFFIDPEIEALRFEAKSLEKKVQELSDEYAELNKLIHEFNVRYNQELGELILNILNLRKEKSRNTPQYEDAQKDYEDYYSNYQSTKNEKIKPLSDNELRELKEKYRKASKLCHPDVVDESYKLAAHQIFTELNEAYGNNDLQRVSEILQNLQSGKSFTSKADTANEKLALLQELDRLRNKIKDLISSITKVKHSEVFERIPNIESWDLYFSEKKKQLNTQLEILKEQ